MYDESVSRGITNLDDFSSVSSTLDAQNSTKSEAKLAKNEFGARKQGARDCGKQGHPMEVDAMYGSHSSRGQGGARPKVELRYCRGCGKQGHLIKQCRKKNAQPQAGSSRQVKKCSYCMRSGHLEANCFDKKNGKPRKNQRVSQVNDEVSELEGAEWGELSDKEISDLMAAGSRVNQLGEYFHRGLTQQGRRSTRPRF